MNNRIYYIGNFIFPDGNAAGKRVSGNVKLFTELGYEVVVICFQNKDKSTDKKEYYNFKEGVEIIPFESYKRTFNLKLNHRNLLLVKKIITNRKNPDILDTLIYYGSPGYSILIANLISFCRKNQVTIISDVVDWLNVRTSNPFFNLVANIDNFLLKSKINKKVDGAIVISTFLQKYYSKSIKKLIVIPPLAIKTMQSIDLSSGNLQFTYAGQLFRAKDKKINPRSLKDRIDIVVHALYLLKRDGIAFKMHIYGFDKDQYLKAIPSQKMIVDYLLDNVIFHGLKPNNEIIETIAGSHFTILIRENTRDSNAGFPTKVSESISLGTPVITTDTSDIKQYLNNNRNVFFVECDSYSLYNALKKIAYYSQDQLCELKHDTSLVKAFMYTSYLEKARLFLESINKR